MQSFKCEGNLLPEPLCDEPFFFAKILIFCVLCHSGNYLFWWKFMNELKRNILYNILMSENVADELRGNIDFLISIISEIKDTIGFNQLDRKSVV